MALDWVELVLDPLLADYGRPVAYLSPDEMVTVPRTEEDPPLVGLLLKNGVPLGPDAEDTGGVEQLRTVLRLRAQDFPDGVEPEQFGFIQMGEDRYLVSDVLADENGWYDLPLAEAAG